MFPKTFVPRFIFLPRLISCKILARIMQVLNHLARFLRDLNPFITKACSISIGNVKTAVDRNLAWTDFGLDRHHGLTKEGRVDHDLTKRNRSVINIGWSQMVDWIMALEPKTTTTFSPKKLPSTADILLNSRKLAKSWPTKLSSNSRPKNQQRLSAVKGHIKL